MSIEEMILDEKKYCLEKLIEIDGSIKSLILKIISSLALIVSTTIVATISENALLWDTTTGFVSLITTQFIYMCLTYGLCLLRTRHTYCAHLWYLNKKLKEIKKINFVQRYSLESRFNSFNKQEWYNFYKFLAFLSMCAFLLLFGFTIKYMKWPLGYEEIFLFTFIFVIMLEVISFAYLFNIYKKSVSNMIYKQILEDEKKLV